MKTIKRILPVMLAFCLLFSACRPSPALEETIYLQQAEEVDPDEEMLEPEEEGEPDEQFENEETEEADTPRGEEAEIGASGEEDTAHDSAEPQYAPDANTDQMDAEVPPEEPEAVPEAEEAQAVEPEPETEAEPEPDSTADTVKQVVDAAGRTVTLPENVQTVAAVGAAAQMVEMLGGAGRLAGTNADFKNSSLAQRAFADLGSVAVWWNGDGSGSCVDLEGLLAAHPDVCFEFSGQNTLSASQAEQLEAAGIAYVLLPALNSSTNLKTAVNLVAQVLTFHTDGRSSAAIAGDYSAWIDRITSLANSGQPYSCLYLSEWDGSISYTLDETLGSLGTGVGLAVAYSPTRAQLLSTFWKVANVTNESTRLLNRHLDRPGIYVAPMFHQFNPEIVSDTAMYYGGAECAVSHDLFLTYENGAASYALGSMSFPAVVAADQATAQQLQNNWFWKYHPTDAQGYVVINGMQYYSGISGPYTIYINPQGMCSWADGSLESPLESVWIAACLNGTVAMETVRQETVQFYERFFGCDISANVGEMFPAALECLSE